MNGAPQVGWYADIIAQLAHSNSSRSVRCVSQVIKATTHPETILIPQSLNSTNTVNECNAGIRMPRIFQAM